MTVAVKNAVVLEEKDGMMRWVPKCQYCGALDHSTRFEGSVSPSCSLNTSNYCSECHRSSEVELRG